MSRDYSPKMFLRKTPNSILKEYFDRHRGLAHIDFEALGETEVQPIIEAMAALSEERQKRIEAEFRLVFEMACEAGVKSLIEEAGSVFHNLDWTATFEEMKNDYERAFWAFLNHPQIFRIAGHFYYMDRGTSWRTCFVGRGLNPAVEREEIKKLADALSEFYRKQGRGRYCIVENYRREGPERHCYFAYPEDYANEAMGYDDSGSFRHWPTKPAFEVVFVYKPGNGYLEIRAKGKKKEIQELQQLFAQTILGVDRLPSQESGQYVLGGLMDKKLVFVTDPSDGVERVIIKMLRLDLPGNVMRRITFEADPTGTTQPVHALIERALNKANVPIDDVSVGRAKLQFIFSPRDGQRRKTLTFEISIPDRCTLKDDPLDQIAKKYLEEWGLLSG